VGRRARVDGDASAAGWGGVGVGVGGGGQGRLADEGRKIWFGNGDQTTDKATAAVASGSGIRSGWGRGGRSAAVARERLTDGSRRMLRWEFFYFLYLRFYKISV
jgi:hypothetical protein